ncbi:MAG: hypothetical protein NZ929_03955 [Aigarchaeota archaeon]|nr:hypothetical protein [Aigarchaeota archaeon]MCX8192763.1 hypothetical protein [Nitrososphaeria archaeon]MDW7986010.1 hypothetical protein [Nitrososphaerota archaeon]
MSEEARFWKFTCTKELEEECFQKKLIGAPARLWKEVKEIKKGDIIFLYNIDSDVLHGPFIAETEGIMNIDPYALGRKNPSQVKVNWTNLSTITEASKKFPFLGKKSLSLEASEGKAILDMIKTK